MTETMITNNIGVYPDQILGKGGLGQVYRGFMIDEEGIQTIVAVKFLNNNHQAIEQGYRMIKELGYHENLIQIHEILKIDDQLIVVMEESQQITRDMFDLHKLLPNTLELLYQMLIAIQFLNDNGLMHMDIKLENIFWTCELNGSKKFKLGDFDLVRKIGIYKKKSGSYFYLPKEAFLDGFYDQKADIWSLGLLIDLLLRTDDDQKMLYFEKIFKTQRQSTRKQTYEEILQTNQYIGSRKQNLKNGNKIKHLQSLLQTTMIVDHENRRSPGFIINLLKHNKDIFGLKIVINEQYEYLMKKRLKGFKRITKKINKGNEPQCFLQGLLKYLEDYQETEEIKNMKEFTINMLIQIINKRN